MILRLQSSQIELLKLETKAIYPVESCAILFGKISVNEAVVLKIELAENVLYSSTRFEVDPSKVAAAITEAEKQGLEFIGLFHSHPAPPVPSTIDLKFMHLWGDAIWLILSTTEDNFGAYILANGKINQVIISIE